MTGSVVLDIVIGLVFIYLLYSLLATIIQEIIATNVLNLRAKILEEAIKRMLDDDVNDEGDGAFLSKIFYESSLIKYLGQDKGKKPSYLSAKNFSKVILDILKGPSPQPGDDFRLKIEDTLTNGIGVPEKIIINQGDTFKFLQSLWADAQGDVEKFKASLEQWFDDTMERASGWYKKKTQFILFFIGLFIAVIFNVDTIEIVHKLSSDPKLTAQVVQQAGNFAKEHNNLGIELQQQKQAANKLTDNSKLDSVRLTKLAEDNYLALKKQQDQLLAKADSLLKSDIKNVNGLLGMGIQSYTFKGKDNWERIGFFFLSVIGWVLTALALSLGAPFWFDLLNKLMKLRGSVANASSPNDKSTNKDVSSKKAITIKG